MDPDRKGEVQESELGKLPEERQVGFQVMNKVGQACLCPLDVCECRHRGGTSETCPRNSERLAGSFGARDRFSRAESDWAPTQ